MASSTLAKYPYPSALNVASFVKVRPQLEKDNPQRSFNDYTLWKEQMISLLKSQDLLGFINGETPSPPPDSYLDGESMEELWRRTDGLIKGWILDSIVFDALDAVVGLNSSMEVWLTLENMFNMKMKAHAILVPDQITSVGNDKESAGKDEDRTVEIPAEASHNALGQGQFTSVGRDKESAGKDEDRIVEIRAEASHNALDQDQLTSVGNDKESAEKDEDRIVELPADASHNALDQGNVVSLRKKDINWYLPLYKAALRGDWNEAKEFLATNKEGITVILNSSSETLLHVAVEKGKSNDFLRNLLKEIPDEALVWKSHCGRTALHIAAMAGNTGAAIMLVDKNPQLLYILNDHYHLPVHVAAIGCHKEILAFLISKSKIEENTAFAGKLGAVLLAELIASEYVELALYLVKKYAGMATLKEWHNVTPLQVLAEKKSLFLSGESLSWWQNWIYSCIALEPSTSRTLSDDIEKSLSLDDRATKCSWTEVACRVPCVKRIKAKKVKHQQAVELAKRVCQRVASLPHSEAEPIYRQAIINAAYHGIHEVVEVIIEMFPSAAFVRDHHTGSSIFHLAAGQRLENVFNLIYMMDNKKHFFYDSQDISRNNLMHMCGKIAPPHKLNIVSGAALQMQRELQWFKEMEKFVNPSRRTWKNKDGLTPTMLFTKEHEELKKKGEEWMKGTTSSCTIAAALITTVMFSAAFNVPGGVSKDTGIPILLQKTSFILFTILDSVSLFTSSTSLLLFLSILTSRYAEEDFLYVLPKRLCMGLIALFTSITFMVIAFTVAMYITLHQKSTFLLIPFALLACLPVATFAFLQFPLLIAVLSSTYGRGIFGNKSGRTLY